MLIKLLPALSYAKKIDRDPKVSESPCKIDSVYQNDSIVATRARAVATKRFVTLATLATSQIRWRLDIRKIFEGAQENRAE